MKNSMILLLVCVLGLALTVGCQTNPKFEKYSERVYQETGTFQKFYTYFWDRLLDLTDIVYLDLSVGDGSLFNLHFTKHLQVGAGYRDAVCFGVMPRSFGMWQDDRVEGGVAIPLLANFYYKKQHREALWGTQTLFDHDISYNGPDYLTNETAHWSDIGFSFHGFLAGMDFGISPFEIYDFILGFFGMPFILPVDPMGFGTEIDVANDDVRARKFRNTSDLNYYEYLQDPSDYIEHDPLQKD